MEPLLQIRDLQAHFHTRRGIVKAVNGVSFEVAPGETLGIVGESGSGKSVCQLSYLHLLPSPPLRIMGGEARFGDVDLLKANNRQLRSIRGNRISMIFQEPMTSLNPYMRIGSQLTEPLLVHQKISKREAIARAMEALEQVGISDRDNAMRAYPHEFSGGMRQRVMIAMALTTRPSLLIADEPTTALDVTVQAQILDLLRKIQKENGMAIVLITHDLGVVAGLADRVVVMYAGRVMEQGVAEDIFYRSGHPYTHALLKSTPRLDVVQESLPVIGGAPPDLSRLGQGCPFYERCDFRKDVCHRVFPERRTSGLANEGKRSHDSYCHLEKVPV
jgi:oligopeptide transport system ATP-binding protein